MLPKLNWHAVAIILLTALLWAAAVLVFTSAAFAVSRDGRLYRGYVHVCISEPGRPDQCGLVQTVNVFEDEQACVDHVMRAFAAYEASVLRARPRAVVLARARCTYDPDLNDA